MAKWWESFQKEAIFFVTPDVKRGIGVEDIVSNYHIICSYYDPLIPILRNQGANIFCLEEKIGEKALTLNNTGRLLEHPLIAEYIKLFSKSFPKIVFFKPSLKLDILFKQKGYFPVGNSWKLNERFENKINFINLINKYLPEYAVLSEIGILKKLNFIDLVKKLKLPFIIQFGHGWAGKTTFLIKSERDFNNISKKFKTTRVKVSKYIEGLTILNNCCIYKGEIFISRPAIQLSNIPELHSQFTVTCGRQWPVKFIDEVQIKRIKMISQKIGRLMENSGFKGFFGIDFLIEDRSGKIYLSELNARLTASTPFYTRLERGLGSVPLFVYHLAEFLGKSNFKVTCDVDDVIGSQIIFRSGNLPSVTLDDDVGVFSFMGSRPVLVRRDYFPEKLNNHEFIYMPKNIHKKKNIDEELARIETKMEVLKSSRKLQQWVKNVINK